MTSTGKPLYNQQKSSMKYPSFWNRISFLSIILLPFSLFFVFGTFVRKILSTERSLGYPLVCIGNATIGGTGKTPLIKAIAKRYLEHKKRIVIISKGYGGNYAASMIVEDGFLPSLVGDEAIELFDKLGNLGEVYIIVARSPLDSVALLNQIKPDIILVDDGMQNPSFTKDYKILMVDGSRGFGNGFIIPAGPLRQSISSSIDQADIVLSINPSINVRERIKSLSGNKFQELYARFDADLDTRDRLLLFCAIGNYDRFFSIFREKYVVVKEMSFSDHHLYSKDDVDYISQEAKKLGANKIVTTEKDFSKLKNAKFSVPLEVCKMSFSDMEIDKIIEKIGL
jgi:tetraacyldisaccharide 4'-kinase